jgi:branched-subunit amino acid transport protein AzlD
MESKVQYLLALIVSVGILSWFIRAVPFLLFGRSGEPPKLVVFI